ncbi:MAG: DNA polymerase III subunit alpha [Chloroflexota bacterium]
MSDSFVHLHTHSEYSMLDGLGRIPHLVAEAKRLGQPALALTDHGVMHGAIEFFRECSYNDVKPIIGVEAYQTVWGRPMGGRDAQFDKENYHLLLLAKDMTGYRNLLKIASHSQMDGYYYKPRVDHEFLEKHAKGIICSSGCLGAEVPNLLLQGKEKEAYERLGWYTEVFGKENFFIELQEHSIPELIEVNKTLVPWADKFGLQLLATNDVHYVKEDDASPHEMLLCVQTGVSIKSEKRMRLSDESYFLKSRFQMEETFRPLIDLPASAFDNSVLIAEMCNVDLEDREFHLPDIEIPEGHTYETYLRFCTEEGLERLYGNRAHDDEVQARKEHELNIIKQMGFDVYFLIVADLCNFARSRNIWWNVRGSGAGSLVAYCTGITGIDPLKNQLIFERFLNPARVTMPDFDLDFPDDQREELVRYTIDKYGEDQVAQIVTFGRMKAKAAIRDVGRAQEIPLSDVDRIAKMIPGIPGKPVKIKDVLTEGHEFYNPELLELYEKESWVTELVDMSMNLEGVARHSGIHAAAVIVTDRELTHYTPLMRSTKGGITKAITQFEFPILESIGLLKVDFLGLSTISVMREACRMIQERHGIEYKLDNIPFEGEETAKAFELFSSGEVSGVFQVESQGMRRVLTEMRPNLFEHIIATISLYRPGPLEYIPNYIRRLHGEEEVEYKHDALKPILEETLGIIIYQEQIIQVLSQLAGYTAGEADLVRRAISKKKEKEIAKHKQIFIDGCEKNGIPKKASTAIYEDIEFFARYGFNKCLPGNVEVIDAASGRLVSIEDLYLQKETIAATVSCNTDSLTLQAGAVTDVIDNGIKPVYRLTTALGRTIEATANHPFYTFDGWRLLEELSVGDQIGVPRKIPIEGQKQWPDYELIVLGHLLAEGNLCHPHSIYFSSQDCAQVNDYVQAVEQFENVECSIAIHKGTYSIYAKRQNRSQEPGVVTWAKEHSIWGKNALGKEIPSAIFELNNHSISLLLSRMWEGDGHINESDRNLFYATSSNRLAHQLQHLLLRLNIVSRLRTVTFPYKEGRVGYQLFITGNENISIFRESIGQHFVNQEKVHLLNRLLLTAPSSSGTKDVIPVAIKEHVRAAKEQAGVTWPQLNHECGVAQREFYPTGNAAKSGFTRTTIQRLAEYFQNDELRRYANSDIYWDKVVSIEYVGEKQTYDLEVAQTHNFIANDILVHNSHAADYAVITVQTAYLKAHYPVEYMAALLLIERDKTEKVINFINECRRMGIDVLPPDVNYSGLDFEIQELPADVESAAARDLNMAFTFPVPEGSAIRFGMAAVKNVGEGPVQVILDARNEGGPFKRLEDFCDRVDLRQVNKRSLECLIKVGAFDRFGKRSQLLAVLDQMVASSASTHSARDSGQLSMFDLMDDAGAAEAAPIKLADIEEAKGKDRLQWEKEFLGVYAMSHPMQHLSLDMGKIVTCQCNELGESHDGQNVTMAGMIAGVRTIITKKGDPMAFVTLEDLAGQCDVVVFPTTYAEEKEKLIPDTVVLVKGTAQTREGQTSVLADTIQNYVEQAVAVAEATPSPQQTLIDVVPTINGVPVVDEINESDEVDVRELDYTPTTEDDDAEQAPTLPVNSDYLDPFPSELGEFIPPEEESPFKNDLPDWKNGSTKDIDAKTNSVNPTEAAQVVNGDRSPVAEPKSAVSRQSNGEIDRAGDPSILEPVQQTVESAGLDEIDTDSEVGQEMSADEATDMQTGANLQEADSPTLSNTKLDEASAPVLDKGSSVGSGPNGATGSETDGNETDSSRSANNGISRNETTENGTSISKTGPHHTNGTQNGSNGLSNDNGIDVKHDGTQNGASNAEAHPSNGATGQLAQLHAQETISAEDSASENGAGQNGKAQRRLQVVFARSGNLDRDKYRLREMRERLSDPRGRNEFYITIDGTNGATKLAFPNDYCTINERLVSDLAKYFRVEVSVEEENQ